MKHAIISRGFSLDRLEAEAERASKLIAGGLI